MACLCLVRITHLLLDVVLMPRRHYIFVTTWRAYASCALHICMPRAHYTFVTAWCAYASCALHICHCMVCLRLVRITYLSLHGVLTPRAHYTFVTHQRKAELLRQAPHVVVRLDSVRVLHTAAGRGAGLNHVGVQSALNQKLGDHARLLLHLHMRVTGGLGDN